MDNIYLMIEITIAVLAVVSVHAGLGMAFIGIFSYFIFVPIYTQYFKRADRGLWKSVGSPFIGASPVDAHMIISTLYKKKYLSSENKRFVLISRVMRLIYVLFLLYGTILFGLAAIIINFFQDYFDGIL